MVTWGAVQKIIDHYKTYHTIIHTCSIWIALMHFRHDSMGKSENGDTSASSMTIFLHAKNDMLWKASMNLPLYSWYWRGWNAMTLAAGRRWHAEADAVAVPAQAPQTPAWRSSVPPEGLFWQVSSIYRNGHDFLLTTNLPCYISVNILNHIDMNKVLSLAWGRA